MSENAITTKTVNSTDQYESSTEFRKLTNGMMEINFKFATTVPSSTPIEILEKSQEIENLKTAHNEEIAKLSAENESVRNELNGSKKIQETQNETIEKLKNELEEYQKSKSSIIKLNIGGTHFETTKSTLAKFDGFFSTMLETDVPLTRDENNHIFIDRSPRHFEILLNYMRVGDVIFPATSSYSEILEIQKEAQYYLLEGLVKLCNEKIVEKSKKVTKQENEKIGAEENTFQIFARSPEIYFLDVKISTTIDEVKAMIRVKMGQNLRFRISYRGTYLQDGLTIAHYNIQKHSTLTIHEWV